MKIKKNNKQKIPKVTYQFVDSPDAKRLVQEAYAIVFDHVWESYTPQQKADFFGEEK